MGQQIGTQPSQKQVEVGIVVNKDKVTALLSLSNKSIRELKTADQLNEFIQNDMEYELLKGYFNHYIKYFELDTTVDIKSISTNEWTCTIDESIVHIRINDDIYTLNQNMKFETPHGLVLYILKQKLEINTDDVY